nr:hypothetical protein Iba_chr03cCG4050 [Ipomoea batatas]
MLCHHRSCTSTVKEDIRVKESMEKQKELISVSSSPTPLPCHSGCLATYTAN